MKAGAIVKYSRPVNKSEAELRFILLRDPEKGRADIQLMCDYRIKPIETVEVREIVLADESSDTGIRLGSPGTHD